MRHLRNILITIILTLLFSSFEYPITRKELDNDILKSIYQFSNSHCGMGSDSIVLTREKAVDLYNKIKIYREHKLIFEYGYENLEVEGFPFSVFVEHEISLCKEYFYIFKLFNAPEPSKFLIIKTDKDKTIYFGTTKSSSAEILGDIDYDGKFEIGGYEWYCEYGDSACNQMDLYNVFEVDTNFPTDTILTRCLKQIIKE